jgi:hypothetical protein
MADVKHGNPDDAMKLLDSGAYIVLYRNGLGSYTGVLLRDGNSGEVQGVIDRLDDNGPHITDDWTPSKVLYRLTEKAVFNRIVGAPKSEASE